MIDDTNNHSERSIGWWIKERYRSTPALHHTCPGGRCQGTQCGASVRGYKREQSVLNVSRLIAFAGSRLARGLHLADLIA
jgi:hypothetical protein